MQQPRGTPGVGGGSRAPPSKSVPMPTEGFPGGGPAPSPNFHVQQIGGNSCFRMSKSLPFGALFIV